MELVQDQSIRKKAQKIVDGVAGGANPPLVTALEDYGVTLDWPSLRVFCELRKGEPIEIDSLSPTAPKEGHYIHNICTYDKATLVIEALKRLITK